ncbi:hypothetical protein [Flavobacterium psychrophilum]|uniref:hypothetical protein n=1 Tax=Flavobacterium psychrophilum TaxID=96345 RepID=UPI000B7C4916|nr:hypothetical protein [Flavobacterium psychrophilum]SNA65026.1 hypothetical protein FI146_100027 [Flavobacterium psychrophilum]
MKPIVINIDKLIENFSITGELKESKETITQFVTEALLEAVTDVNLLDVENKKQEPNNARAKKIEQRFNEARYSQERKIEGFTTRQFQTKSKPQEAYRLVVGSRNSAKFGPDTKTLQDLLPASVLCSEVYRDFCFLIVHQSGRDREKYFFEMFHKAIQQLEAK